MSYDALVSAAMLTACLRPFPLSPGRAFGAMAVHRDHGPLARSYEFSGA